MTPRTRKASEHAHDGRGVPPGVQTVVYSWLLTHRLSRKQAFRAKPDERRDGLLPQQGEERRV
jgi:hypothetical protein